MLMLLVVFAFAMLFATHGMSFAQNNTNDAKKSDKDEEDKKKEIETDVDRLEERQSVTKHTMTVGGKKLTYKATAGTLPLKEEESGPKGYAFYIAYTLDTGGKPSQRPITFCFNGGPGASSVWLHLGALGPWRVDTPDEPIPPQPPGRLSRNAETLLDVTDLVFIDPVMTGYSRPAKGEKRELFHGVSEDLRWVGEFVRLYATRNHRWSSPKFLAGESYGTVRASALVNELQNKHGMFFNGVILVSCVLDGNTLDFTPSNDISFVVFLPTYTATAWHHKRLDPKLQKNLTKTLEEARAFARDEYAPALFEGDNLPAARRKDMIQKLSYYTGLDPDVIDRANLRIAMHHFGDNLLRDQRLVTGRLDGRYSGIDLDPAGKGNWYDPSYTAIQGAYASAMNHYVRTDLKFESDLPYEVLTARAHPWKWTWEDGRPYRGVTLNLREAMSKNPHLKVFVANGYMDMATPFFGTEYTFSRLGLDASIRANVSMGFYEAGHMMYVHGPSLKKLKKDLAAFIASAM